MTGPSPSPENPAPPSQANKQLRIKADLTQGLMDGGSVGNLTITGCQLDEYAVPCTTSAGDITVSGCGTPTSTAKCWSRRAATRNAERCPGVSCGGVWARWPVSRRRRRLRLRSSVQTLRDFVQNTQSARARFAQVVVDRNLKKISEATGTMQFQRPGRFRWEYQKPYEQVIVGDGTRIWIHDRDLNQVTVRKLDRALGSSPAALLAGSNEIERDYALTSLGNQEGLDWVEATPKGVGGYFHREWTRARNSESGYVPHFFPWWIEPEYRLPVYEGEEIAPSGKRRGFPALSAYFFEQ